MAYVLNDVLLRNFTAQEKDYFAQKVFLIVNQIDVIRQNQDRRRLR